jgi:excisionase family DNA binding protein
MRTIKQTIEYFKKQDQETALTEWGLRQMILKGEIKYHKAGNKYLINLDYLEKYLNHDES